MVRPPGQGGQLPGRRLHGLRLAPRPCLARLPPVSARGVGPRRATTPGMPRTAGGALSNAPGAVPGDAHAWGAQVPHSWVTGDDELGRHTRFRGELRQRGERYV